MILGNYSWTRGREDEDETAMRWIVLSAVEFASSCKINTKKFDACQIAPVFLSQSGALIDFEIKTTELLG